jgi:omega-3 fatty acid desaturase (delta-15 desaturase)
MYHNHVEKDYSHPWYTEERLQREDEHMARWFHDNNSGIAILPRLLWFFYGWQFYLFGGMPDGSHMIPFKDQRMWKESNSMESIKCVISCANTIAFAVGIYLIFNGNLADIAFYYLPPWIISGWWLMIVTYLQHHAPETVVYDDSDWSFVQAAFETVDRSYGFGIDFFHHHITDGHVAHHLFFTKIPHYNLPIATEAIKRYLDQNGLIGLYQNENTYDFAYRAHSYFMNFGYKAHYSPTNPRSENKKIN